MLTNWLTWVFQLIHLLQDQSFHFSSKKGDCGLVVGFWTSRLRFDTHDTHRLKSSRVLKENEKLSLDFQNLFLSICLSFKKFKFQNVKYSKMSTIYAATLVCNWYTWPDPENLHFSQKIFNFQSVKIANFNVSLSASLSQSN